MLTWDDEDGFVRVYEGIRLIALVLRGELVFNRRAVDVTPEYVEGVRAFLEEEGVHVERVRE